MVHEFSYEHRQFIQFMLKKGVVSYQTASEFYQKIRERQNDYCSLEQHISQINTKISAQELQIVFTKCDLSNEDKVILLNTSSDNITKLLGIFTPMELVYFQIIVKEILTTEEHKIPEAICLNLAKSDLVMLKNDDAEDVLNKWIEMEYFARVGRTIHLGCRSIEELTPYFHQYFKDYIKSCGLCSELAFSGCSCISCKEVFHRKCMDKFLLKHKFCPNCNTPWSNNDTQKPSSSQNT